MMEMEKEGITWVGNIPKKFKNMLLEIFEVAVYLVNQMRIVGKSIKRFYSDVMEELLPYRYETMAGKLPVDDQHEISNVNQNQDEDTHSTPSSAEVATLASVTDCCNEIVNASVEQTSTVVEVVESAEEEKVMKKVSSSSMFEDPSAEQGDNKTMQQDDDDDDDDDDELNKVEETCVMVTRDELQLVSKETINMKTSEKSARKQEYEELAIYNENGKGDNVEISSPTLLEDKDESLFSEQDWEFL